MESLRPTSPVSDTVIELASANQTQPVRPLGLAQLGYSMRGLRKKLLPKIGYSKWLILQREVITRHNEDVAEYEKRLATRGALNKVDSDAR